jgi:TonB family protein
MLKKASLSVALLYVFFPAAIAAGEDLRAQIKEQYVNKVLYLRHPFVSESQEYDSAGKNLTVADEGPWWLYGRILVTKVAIDRDKVRVEGKRAAFKSDGRACGKGCLPYAAGTNVTVTIRLTGPVSSTSDIDIALGRAFALTPQDILNSVPSYWREYVAQTVAPDFKKDAAQSEGSQGEEIFKSKDPGVTMPKALYSPEPEFSEIARRERFQGVVSLNVVIDKTGRVSRASIAHAAGLGLDEQAVRTVRTWRFNPAQRNGKPVAVSVYIEVAFHLYR